MPLHPQAPLVHVSPGLQAVPHVPQRVVLLLTSTHAPSQHATVEPAQAMPLHLQTPPSQVSPSGHVLPQPPQFCGSFMVFEQPVGQQVSVTAQDTPLQRHLPPTQCVSPVHALPHAPQL